MLNSLTILTFHKIIHKVDKSKDINNLEVSVNDLEYFIKKFKKLNFNFLSMDDFIFKYKNNIKIKNSLIMTLDDGHPESLRNILTICNTYRIPFTIYLTTNFMTGKSVPWWEIVQELNHKNTFGKVRLQNKETQMNNLRDTFINSNQETYFKLFHSFFLIKNKSSLSKIMKLTTYKLDINDINNLISCKYITIGSHCMSHQSLSSLTEKQLNDELFLSKNFLEKIFKRKIIHLSYPYGHDYTINKNVISRAKKVGYKTGVSTDFFQIGKNSILYLPRINATSRFLKQNIIRTLLIINFPKLTLFYSKVLNFIYSKILTV